MASFLSADVSKLGLGIVSSAPRCWRTDTCKAEPKNWINARASESWPELRAGLSAVVNDLDGQRGVGVPGEPALHLHTVLERLARAVHPDGTLRTAGPPP